MAIENQAPERRFEFVVSFDQGTLLLSGGRSNRLDRESIEAIFGSDVWSWDSRVSCWRCEAIHYRRVILALWEKRQQSQHRSETVAYQDQAQQWGDAIQWQKQEIHPPRTEQSEAIDAWMNDKRGLVVMPTGTGKTEVALHLLNQTRCSALVVSPVRDLMYQWHRRILSALGYDAGVIGDNTFNVRPISVTTYDSAAIHAAKLAAHSGL